jgi:simple sugar transport system permease protein
MANEMREEMHQTPENRSPLRWLSEWYQENSEMLRLGLITVAVFAVLATLSPDLFLSSANLRSMAFQVPEIALLALAILVAMLTGGIDLSIIGVMNLAAILGGMFLSSSLGMSTWLQILLTIVIVLATGLACGLINGLLISRLGIVPILATLGTWQVFSGIGVVLTGGAAVYGFPASFANIGNDSWLGIPIPLYILLLLSVALAFTLNRSRYGHSLFMLGSNPKAGRFAGLPSGKLILFTYMVAGLLASASGVIVMSRVNSIRVDFGSSYLLLAILIAVLGGVNPYGGFGKVGGVILAVLTLQFVSSGLNLLRFSNFAREVVWGGLLLAVMVVNSQLFDTWTAGLRRRWRGGRAAERTSKRA